MEKPPSFLTIQLIYRIFEFSLFLINRNTIEAVNVDELVYRLKAKNIVALKVCPGSECKNSHTDNAISVSWISFQHNAKDFQKQKEYIAYCRVLLVEGFPDWKLL